MSTVSMAVVDTNIRKMEMDIRDLENEIDTTKDFVEQLTSSLAREQIRLCELGYRVNQKQNMIHSLSVVQEHRKERLRQEHKLKHKMAYIQKCQEYLMTFSTQPYTYDEMVFDEIVEYAHKLHLIACVKKWIVYKNMDTSEHIVHFPDTELSFDVFEARSIENDQVRVWYSSANGARGCYTIPVKVWYRLFELENEHGFTVFSDVSIFGTLFEEEEDVSMTEVDMTTL